MITEYQRQQLSKLTQGIRKSGLTSDNRQTVHRLHHAICSTGSTEPSPRPHGRTSGADEARERMLKRQSRNDSVPPAEMKTLLERRAKRLLQEQGLGLQKLRGGAGYQIVRYNPDLTEETVSQFENIIVLGVECGFWRAEDDSLSRDPETGLDSPTMAAVRERGDSDEGEPTLQNRMLRQQVVFFERKEP